MGGQVMSLRRIVVTNIFILLVIFMVGMCCFHQEVLHAISAAAKTPVFTLRNSSNSVGLEIVIGSGADFKTCANILQEQDINASIFLSPALIREQGDEIDLADLEGQFAGYYMASDQDEELNIAISADTMILKDDAWDVSVFAPRSRRDICWTLDANRALSEMDYQSFSEKIYDGCIILYRYENNAGELKNLIKIIQQKGYNITEVKTT